MLVIDSPGSVEPGRTPMMTGLKTTTNALSALLMFLGMLASGAAVAQDQPIKRTELLRSDLADVPGKQTVIYVADVVPGGEGQRHTHHGDEYVYILEGTLTVKPDGKDPIALSKGQAAHIAPGDGIHAAMNGSKSEPAKVLVILVVEKGKPLAEAAK
jgi:quercetin dioxygenase-like cupin family protein